MPNAAAVQAIEGLVKDRKTLLRKLKRNGHNVNWTEHQTRYALLDPVLRALGWDLSNPRQVGIEASNSNRDKADYLLFDQQGNPKVVVEAKRVTPGDIDATLEYEGVTGEELDWQEWSERELIQLRNYWKNYRPGLAVLSSGLFWDIYELPDRRGIIETKRINYFNILSQPPADYMTDLMKLHFSNIQR